MALIGKFLKTTELTKEKGNGANNGTSKKRITVKKPTIKKPKNKKKSKKKKEPSVFQKAMSHTGNEYQKMTYDELAEVTRSMARATRRRLKNIQEGHAYLRLHDIAAAEDMQKSVAGLALDEEGNIKISTRFTGKNKLSMPELRTLRKVLYNYLTDETSTKAGLEKHRKKQAKILDLDDDFWDQEDISLGDILDRCETTADLIRFGQNRLDWDSSQIYAAIIECGGYQKRNSPQFYEKLKKKIEEQLGERRNSMAEDMSGFFYNDTED